MDSINEQIIILPSFQVLDQLLRVGVRRMRRPGIECDFDLFDAGFVIQQFFQLLAIAFFETPYTAASQPHGAGIYYVTDEINAKSCRIQPYFMRIDGQIQFIVEKSCHGLLPAMQLFFVVMEKQYVIHLKSSSGVTLSYQPNSTTDATQFSLYANKNSTYYRTSSDAGLSANAVTMACPYGFIVVPGSSTYGTSDFCVMKYEAKQYSSTVPISQASSTPWTGSVSSLSQSEATTYSQNVAGCTGCHLITDAEYLTIVQNVLNINSNWDNGAGVHTVGTGYIYSGNNDATPGTLQAASTNDSEGYYGTSDSSPSNQRRTLTLSNGEVIWDIAGNAWEWTSGQSVGGQPGLISDASYTWKEWKNANVTGNLFPNTFPSFGTSVASGWDSTNGIGQLYSNSNDTTTVSGHLRGGTITNTAWAGVTTLYLGYAPSNNTGPNVGFRVAR